MRNRRRNWFLRRLVLGFAIALVVVPVAQARPEGALPPLAHSGANTQGTFVQGIDDFPGSSFIAPEQGALVRGDYKDGVGTSPVAAVIAGDDKRGIRTPTSGIVLVGDDKRNVPLGTNYEPTVAAQYNQFGYRHALPQDFAREPIQVVSNPSDGFDWSDAGIGAGTIFAVMLLGAGALLATRPVGRPAQV
jgi:hypothetical protein